MFAVMKQHLANNNSITKSNDSRNLLSTIIICAFLICICAGQSSPQTGGNSTCELEGTLNCSLFNNTICPVGTTEILINESTFWSCNQPLMLNAEYIAVAGYFSGLSLNVSKSLFLQDVYVDKNLTIVYGRFIQIFGFVIVGNIMTVDVIDYSYHWPYQDQVTINLYQADIMAQRIIIQCQGILIVNQSVITTEKKVCLYSNVILDDYAQKIWDEEFIDMSQILSIDLTLAVSSLGSIFFIDSEVNTSTSLFVSREDLSLIESTINASARSCRTNMGSGRGLTIQSTAQTCTSGGAGAGYGLSSNQTCGGILQYFMFLTHSFPYMSKGPFLSTGSGGYGYEDTKFQPLYQKGAGGGFVFMFIKQTFLISSSYIAAAGGTVDSTDSLSAGSGGTIFIYANKISDDNTYNVITVAGGGSFNNKGAGSGGMVKISFQLPKPIHSGLIWVNVSQGYQPDQTQTNLDSNGLFFGPICPSGTARYYLGCQPCSAKHYNAIGSQFCVKCPISNEFDLNQQSIALQNPWECFQNMEQNPYYLWVMPGQIDLLSIGLYIGLLVIFLILGFVIRRKVHQYKKKKIIEFDFQSLQNDIKQSKILTEKLKKQKDIKPYELMYHIHRITLSGSNTDLCPWVLPIIPPQIIKKYVLNHAYESFASKFNKIAKWTKLEIFLTKIFYLIYPIHWYYYDLVKKRKYHKLCALLDQSRQYNLINNYDFQDKDLITLKFSKNKDYTSCYIDFFFYEKANLSYYNLSVPFIIYLSGEGNFIRPFYLQENDPFLNALAFIVNRNLCDLGKSIEGKNALKNKNSISSLISGGVGSIQSIVSNNNNIINSGSILTEDRQSLFSNLVNLNTRCKNLHQLRKFIYKFNAISCTLDLSAPINTFIETLEVLIDFINSWNKKFFNEVKVQIDLILMISDLHQENIVSSSIHILSNKDRNDFMRKVKAVIPRMNLNSQIDLKIGLFIYNPEQQIQKSEEQIKQNQANLPRASAMLSGSFGQSEQDYQHNPQQISQPLLDDEQYQQNGSPRKSSKGKNKQKSASSNFSWKLTRIFCLFRYFLFSHQITRTDKYTIKILQTFLILTQTMIVFVWSIKIQIPYVFVNLVAPFIGILWMVSDSYGFGKLFMILNGMNLLNQTVTLLVYSLAWGQPSTQNGWSSLIKISVCQVINIIIVLGNMIMGCRSITFSKKNKMLE